jgi:hypothetical protein
MVRTPKNVVVRAKDDPIGDLIVVAKKANKVFWDENDWDRLADIVWKMKATSTDGLARIASLAQKQFPQKRQRPGILTVSLLKPLVQRIRKMEEEMREQAERAGALAAQVTFFQGVPATKQEIITSLTDDEIRQHFFGRFLTMLTVDDIANTFSPDQLVGSLETGDLGAVVAKRIIECMERPTEVTVHSTTTEKKPVAETNHKPITGPVIRRKKIIVIGAKGEGARQVRDRVDHLCNLDFMEPHQLQPGSIPLNCDLVILWSRHVSKTSKMMVFQALPSSKIYEHFRGVKEMAKMIESFCQNKLTEVRAG